MYRYRGSRLETDFVCVRKRVVGSAEVRAEMCPRDMWIA